MTIERYRRNLERIDLKINSEKLDFNDALFRQDWQGAYTAWHNMKIWQEIRREIQIELDALTAPDAAKITTEGETNGRQ